MSTPRRSSKASHGIVDAAERTPGPALRRATLLPLASFAILLLLGGAAVLAAHATGASPVWAARLRDSARRRRAGRGLRSSALPPSWPAFFLQLRRLHASTVGEHSAHVARARRHTNMRSIEAKASASFAQARADKDEARSKRRLHDAGSGARRQGSRNSSSAAGPATVVWAAVHPRRVPATTELAARVLTLGFASTALGRHVRDGDVHRHADPSLLDRLHGRELETTVEDHQVHTAARPFRTAAADSAGSSCTCRCSASRC